MVLTKVTSVVDPRNGDAGKGKIVDFVTAMEGYDVGLQHQGGGGAGHTVVVDGREYKLNCISASIITPGRIAVSGQGKVIHPPQFLEDVEKLRRGGITVAPEENLFVSRDAVVVSSLDILLDTLTGQRVGTTGSGSGPAYMGRMARTAPLFRDLGMLDDHEVRERIADDTRWKSAVIREYGGNPPAPPALFRELAGYWPLMERYLADTTRLVRRLRETGKRVIAETTQGWGIDIFAGSYPFVTSASTTAGAASTCSGIMPGDITRVISVVRGPYATRVGEGPFAGEYGDYQRVKQEYEQEKQEHPGRAPGITPDELAAALAGDRHLIGKLLRTAGSEFGAKTGRPRRVGQPHWGMVREADQWNNTTEYAVTKVDVFPEGYEVIPIRAQHIMGTEVDYDHSDGNEIPWHRGYRWKAIQTGEERMKLVDGGFDAFERGLQEYLLDFSRFTGHPIRYVSVGRERRHTVVKGVFEATSSAIIPDAASSGW